jgi:UDP-N-acetylmuramate--alanine ligase
MRKRVHLIGIGGAGMSGIARVLLARGWRVSGSDQVESEATRRLRREGAAVAIGHDAANVGDVDRVLYSAAVAADNPELCEAARRGIPRVRRDVALGELMAGAVGIAVAGTHGKTTTTGMLATLFLQAGEEPTILIGGDLPAIGGNARAGRGPVLITEACEAYDSFLELSPRIAIVTNVEADHLDYHGSLEGVVRAFCRFVARIAPDGCAVLNAGDPHTPALREALRCRSVEFALEADGPLPPGAASEASLYAATEIHDQEEATSFVVWRDRERLGEVRLSVPGRHNVANALAAGAAALEAGLSFAAVRDGLAAFTGTGRRFETLAEVAGVRVIDDYAHHPTEIRATLAAAQVLGRPITVIFQPHLYSRTRDLLEEFAASFGAARRVVVTEIYAAREAPLPGVDAGQLATAIRAVNPAAEVWYLPRMAEIAPALAERVTPGEVVLTLGAGDIRWVGEELVERLQKDRATGSVQRAT